MPVIRHCHRSCCPSSSPATRLFYLSLLLVCGSFFPVGFVPAFRCPGSALGLKINQFQDFHPWLPAFLYTGHLILQKIEFPVREMQFFLSRFLGRSYRPEVQQPCPCCAWRCIKGLVCWAVCFSWSILVGAPIILQQLWDNVCSVGVMQFCGCGAGSGCFFSEVVPRVHGTECRLWPFYAWDNS